MDMLDSTVEVYSNPVDMCRCALAPEVVDEFCSSVTSLNKPFIERVLTKSKSLFNDLKSILKA